MEPLGKFPRVPWENIEGPLRDFPRAKPKGNPERDLQYSPEGLPEYSRDFPRGSIHHDTPSENKSSFRNGVKNNSLIQAGMMQNMSVEPKCLRHELVRDGSCVVKYI